MGAYTKICCQTLNGVVAVNYNFNSTTGGLRPPAMTTAQRDAIATPATGLTLIDTDTNTLNLFDATNWQQFGPQTVIKGSGNDATTTALLVENSAGADILKVNDAGQISIIRQHDSRVF